VTLGKAGFGAQYQPETLEKPLHENNGQSPVPGEVADAEGRIIRGRVEIERTRALLSSGSLKHLP
jgi:hypothetical protein